MLDLTDRPSSASTPIPFFPPAQSPILNPSDHRPSFSPTEIALFTPARSPTFDPSDRPCRFLNR
ncbi:hypothetical protein JOY44_02035 [Phormidium sp. CLA17]|uniref:hypothetical protein n=1 Tax=Leptolyngbya sp. Cla-17 TaxID=2803751 RepID=UPI0017E8DD02|nr:hypothetical protein [Leptolyngbya sp. Cla-17]MBM0740407.1 hypothetical protein [Leptolyngbya sp. Cla-17]